MLLLRRYEIVLGEFMVRVCVKLELLFNVFIRLVPKRLVSLYLFIDLLCIELEYLGCILPLLPFPLLSSIQALS